MLLVQIWRLVTHIFISDKLGFKLLFHVIWILTYGSTLESSTYSMHPEDYLFLFFFGTGCLSLVSFVMGPLLSLGYITHTGTSMVMMLLYVWSKEFPEQVSGSPIHRLLQRLPVPASVIAAASTQGSHAHAGHQAVRSRQNQGLLVAVRIHGNHHADGARRAGACA
jgi:Der1-like family